MSVQQPRYSAEETARRGDEIYERTIRAQVEATHSGKVVAIDIETGAYAIDDNALRVARCLRAHHPEAEVWFVRVGHRNLHHIGGRPVLGRL
jgi:mannose-6-phosphate isomerase-like protein (cupin superfamily)